MSTVHDARYIKLIEHLISVRNKADVTQVQLADALRQEQSFVSKVENFERRLDIIELYDWLGALNYPPQTFFREIDWFVDMPENDTGLPALPIPGQVKETAQGVLLQLAWQGQVKEVLLEGISQQNYLSVEKAICGIYAQLNESNSKLKNREAIYQALEYAVLMLPALNPSDIYHHIVYRLYLREYSKTQADRSWVRAGGEAIELFIEKHYNAILKPQGIEARWLINAGVKSAALKSMGIAQRVGKSKLDIALYGIEGDNEYIFGGIHAKASLAERVSDDVPCSEAMISKGYVSYLFTFDAKSFPPPKGDLVNRGELGSPTTPSDKRKYIEDHGSFTACYSYNTRTVPSAAKTKSGKQIYVSSFDFTTDLFPRHIVQAWREYRRKNFRR